MTLTKAYGDDPVNGSALAGLYAAYGVPKVSEGFRAVANWEFTNGSLVDTIGGLSLAVVRGSGATYIGPNKQITWAGNYFTDSVNLEGSGATNVGVVVSGQKVTIDTSTPAAHKIQETSVATVLHKVFTADHVVERGNTQWVAIQCTDGVAHGGRQNFDLVNGVLGIASAVGSGSVTKASIVSLGTGPNGGEQWRLRVTVDLGGTTHGGTAFALFIFLQANNSTFNFLGNGTDFFHIHQRQWVPGNNMPPYVVSTGGANLDAPRFTHDPSTGEELGLLVERAATNLSEQSIDISNSAWAKTNTTITANDALAPDGTMTADKMQHTVDGASIINADVLTSSGITCFSTFIKKGGHQWVNLTIFSAATLRCWFDITNGVVGSNTTAGGAVFISADIEDYGDWWRIHVTSSGQSSGSAHDIAMQNSTADASTTEATATSSHIWGVQHEQATKPSSIIITDAATITRLADPASGLLSLSEHTVVVHARSSKVIPSSNQAVFQADNVSATNRTRYVRDNSPDLRYLIVTTGSTVADVNNGVLASDTDFKGAYRCKTNDMNQALNGAAGTADASAGVPSGMTTIRIGSQHGGANIWDGTIKKITIYDVGLTDAQMEALTS